MTSTPPLEPEALPAAPEILDLRHFSASQLRPLLREECVRWQRRLHWDYTSASNMLLEYLDNRVLPGFVALAPGGGVRSGAVLGYAFCVFEAAKAVVGDVYAVNETESLVNPVCERLLEHLLEMLQAAPGLDRVESQLLMFPAGALAAPFQRRGFRAYPRLFMLADLGTAPAAKATEDGISPESGLILDNWRQEFYEPAAELIHRAYQGHTDANINDQYRTLSGAQRFLHNIIRFPGCGSFDAAHSVLLRRPGTGRLAGLLLSSRVRPEVAHITQLCVDPELRSRGLAGTLLSHAATELRRHGVRQVSLTVTESNRTALELYQRQGFVSLHRFEAMVWERQSVDGSR